MSRQVRRLGLLANAKQIRWDEDSYNDFNVHKAFVERLDLNLENDLSEDEQPTTYPDDPPGDDQ